MNGQENSKEDTDENYVFDLCDKLLVTTSFRKNMFDFHVDGYYKKYKIAIAYCEKHNTDSVNYFDKLNIQLIVICYADFNSDKQNKIIRNTAFDTAKIRSKLTSLK